MRRILFTMMLLMGLQTAMSQEFVRVENGQFIRNGKPYHYVGANFWYGAVLGSKGQGGDRARLAKELDFLKSIGVDNLRVLVGSDGLQAEDRYVPSLVYPTLQTAPGVYNDTILDGLDYFMAELKKRDMLAVLYLNNSWEWSGGYGQYLEWAGEGECPHPSEAGYSAFMKHVAGFATNKKAQNLFYKHVKNIMKRTNRYTGVKYVDDPTIMSWQIGNEPRAFTKDYSVDQAPQRAAFAAWLAKTSKLMKKLDKNHMVSTGSEGKHGCEEDMELFEKVHADKNVDYICIHIWPFNWGWIKAEKDGNGNVPGTKGGWIGAEAAKDSTKAYLDEALVVAKRLQKPIVIEEFGFPRDHGAYAIGSETTARDSYYKCVFDLVKDPSRPLVAGCNFWAWGGWAKPTHEIWKPYDPYTGDPAQEAQGLNSVFVSDKTVWVIKKANEE